MEPEPRPLDLVPSLPSELLPEPVCELAELRTLPLVRTVLAALTTPSLLTPSLFLNSSHRFYPTKGWTTWTTTLIAFMAISRPLFSLARSFLFPSERRLGVAWGFFTGRWPLA